MIQLKLDEGEVKLLSELVDKCLADLREEIHRTENHDYKEMLNQRKAIVIKLQEALENTHK